MVHIGQILCVDAVHLLNENSGESIENQRMYRQICFVNIYLEAQA